MRRVLSPPAIALAVMATVNAPAPAQEPTEALVAIRLAQVNSADSWTGGPAPPSAAKPETKSKPVPRRRRTARRAPKPSPTDKTYSAMTEAERFAIQADLIWTGHYVGMVDGEFGEGSIGAVKAFQKQNNATETGILTPQEREKLAAVAKAKQAEVGWRVIVDRATGARLGLPVKLVPRAGRRENGTRWTSQRGDVQLESFRFHGLNMTLAVVASQERGVPNRVIEYDVQRPDFFVLSGRQANKKFYLRAHAENGDVRGFIVLYEPAMEAAMQPVIVAMSSAFSPFNRKVATDGSIPRRKVEYSTGTVVSSAGDIVADRLATQGCDVIVVPPFGPADRRAENAAAGLALLHLNGARGMPAIRLASGAGRGTSVTLIGIADPLEQAGGGRITTPTVQLDEAAPAGRPRLKAAPTLGFSGAPAFDGQGRFRGIVHVHAQTVAGPAQGESQASIAPADAVRAFLRTHGIAPVPGRSGVANAKAAVVRVICVRP